MSDARPDPSAAAVLAEEATLVFPGFSHDDAWVLGGIITGLAQDRELPVAIDIRRGDQQVFHAALRGSTADNDDWIARKVATARRFERSSLVVRLRAAEDGSDLQWLDRAVYAISGGCVPVKLDGEVLVGTVTVSGLPDVDDHALVVEGMRRFLGSR